jgi:hypothetical protein
MWGEPKDKTPLVDIDLPYKKKAKPKTVKKSNHKHTPEHIIGRWVRPTQNYKTGQMNDVTMHAHMTRCTICGKIGWLPWREARELDSNEFYGAQSDLPTLYPNLEVVDVPRPW